MTIFVLKINGFLVLSPTSPSLCNFDKCSVVMGFMGISVFCLLLCLKDQYLNIRSWFKWLILCFCLIFKNICKKMKGMQTHGFWLCLFMFCENLVERESWCVYSFGVYSGFQVCFHVVLLVSIYLLLWIRWRCSE